MARPVDPEKHEARRLQIIDAAVTCFAARGFDNATTAEICRTAGIGSGTLFHYFPNKLALLTAVIEFDTQLLSERFGAGEQGRDAVVAHVRNAVEEAKDPRTAGFVVAAASQMSQPMVGEALRMNDATLRKGLTACVRKGQRAGEIRTDMKPAQLASWVALLVDGFISRLLVDQAFDIDVEATVLLALLDDLLDG